MPFAKDAQSSAGLMIGPHWYAVRTKPRQEDTALQNLTRQGYTAYLPRICLKKRRRNRWCEVVEPLFPGYLFLRVDLQTDNVSPVRSTLGVAGMVRFGTHYQPLPDSVIEYFRQKDAAADSTEMRSSPFRPGDRVRILSGPFAGLEAVYQMSRSEERALLLMHILGSTQHIAVPFDDIGSTSRP